MKTDVEKLSPTRVKLTIEVPFSELKASLDKAYREFAKHARIPGFRPGHVPPRVIDQRVGRAAVLEEAVQDAVPKLYDQALADNEVIALGQPELAITKIDDGKELAFTAEVDIRPSIQLPDLTAITVTVDDAVVDPDEVEEYLGQMRERFASLKTADRPAAAGDYVSMDLSASVNGKLVEDAQASGISYQVGEGSLLDGLDGTLTGMAAGDAATFTTELTGGEHEGQPAEVAVTVHGVKVKELPDLDDEFAQSASEYDTLGEFRAGIRTRLLEAKRMSQVSQARDRALDALVTQVDFPVPERMLTAEVEQREQALTEQLKRSGASRKEYLKARGVSDAELAAEFSRDGEKVVRAGFLLDELTRQEKLQVLGEELNAFIVEQAYRLGVPPDQLAKRIVDQGQLQMAAAEVLRAKALRLLGEKVKVADASGQPVDVVALTTPADAEATGDGAEAAEPAEPAPAAG